MVVSSAAADALVLYTRWRYYSHMLCLNIAELFPRLVVGALLCLQLTAQLLATPLLQLTVPPRALAAPHCHHLLSGLVLMRGLLQPSLQLCSAGLVLVRLCKLLLALGADLRRPKVNTAASGIGTQAGNAPSPAPPCGC